MWPILNIVRLNTSSDSAYVMSKQHANTGMPRQHIHILQKACARIWQRVRWAGWGLIFRLCDWISSRWPSRLPEHSCSYVAFGKHSAVRMYAVRHKAVCTVPADVDIVNYAPWTSGISSLTDRNRRKAHQAVHGGSIWVTVCNTDTRNRDGEADVHIKAMPSCDAKYEESFGERKMSLSFQDMLLVQKV